VKELQKALKKCRNFRRLRKSEGTSRICAGTSEGSEKVKELQEFVQELQKALKK
jgi:hypothetical protein